MRLIQFESAIFISLCSIQSVGAGQGEWVAEDFAIFLIQDFMVDGITYDCLETEGRKRRILHPSVLRLCKKLSQDEEVRKNIASAEKFLLFLPDHVLW